MRYDLYGWFDGACYPRNPGGFGGWGIVLRNDWGILHKDGGQLARGPHMSNNVAEYHAVANLLELIEETAGVGWNVLIRGDSNLVIRQLSGIWKVRRGKKGLYVAEHDRAKAVLDRLGESGVLIDLRWIPREENEEADALSTTF